MLLSSSVDIVRNAGICKSEPVTGHGYTISGRLRTKAGAHHEARKTWATTWKSTRRFNQFGQLDGVPYSCGVDEKCFSTLSSDEDSGE
jgi:hypothetical protein